MTAPFIATYDDVLQIVKAFAASHGAGKDQASIRYCIEAALREIVTVRDWKCLHRPWRVPLQKPQTTGTVVYSASGGASDYLCTLTGATVPTWAADAQIRLGAHSVICDIDQIISSTEFTLRPPRIPAEDITTGVSYTIGRGWYELPPEFLASWSPAERNARYIGEYVPFDQWHLLEKYRSLTGNVRRWTIGPALNRYGTMALYVDPWASSTSEYDFVMKCRPRVLSISGQDPWNYAGTVSVESGSATVTGDGTSFRSTMLGAIIRFSESASKPTGTNGINPYVFQQSITAVDTTAQTMTIGAVSSVALSGVKYMVTDPVDLDIGLYDAFLRCCEKYLAYTSGMKDAAAIERQYQLAIQQAKITDNSARWRATAGSQQRGYTRLSDNPNRGTFDLT